jgi:3-oxoadipate enol-lactonase
MATETGFADLSGTRLHYVMSGEGPPILLLHGFTLDHRIWRRQIEGLSSRFRVVAYDARGFGKSELPRGEPYHHCRDAAELCKKLGLSRVVVVGHSIGAHQMLELALLRPNLVVGWAGICSSGLAGLAFTDDLQALFAAIRTKASTGDVEGAKKIWKAGDWFAPAYARPDVARELDAILSEYSGWQWTHDNPSRPLDPPAASRLSEVRVPALIVTGGKDLPYNDQVAALLREGLPHATSVHIPDAGHIAPMETPEEITAAIASFAERAFAT